MATNIERIRASIEDPMWSNHAEVPKSLLIMILGDLAELEYWRTVHRMDKNEKDEAGKTHFEKLAKIRMNARKVK